MTRFTFVPLREIFASGFQSGRAAPQLLHADVL